VNCWKLTKKRPHIPTRTKTTKKMAIAAPVLKM